MDAFHLIYLSGVSAAEHSLGEAIRSSDSPPQSTVHLRRPSGAHIYTASLENTLVTLSSLCSVCIVTHLTQMCDLDEVSLGK